MGSPRPAPPSVSLPHYCLPVSHRPLVFVSGLTVGDYLLWNWSLAGNHVALALISGFTLVPLAIVFLLLLAVSLARLIAQSTRPVKRQARHPRRRPRTRSRTTAAGGIVLGEPPTSTTPAGTSSSKLAA
jgi:hypothetical protein